MATDNRTKDHCWQEGRSVLQCLRHMLEHEVSCDVTFQVHSIAPDREGLSKISAHRFMLRARSPVFEAMFAGKFSETYSDVHIHDIDKEAFRQMLSYMYYEEVSLSGDNVLMVMFAGKKYLLTGLVDECKRFLEEEMADDNVCSIMEHSLKFEEHELVNQCLTYIAPRVRSIIQSDGFYKLSQDALLRLLQCDGLTLGVEAELYQACIQWSRKRAGQDTDPDGQSVREMLGDCLHQIRFHTLTVEEFAQTVEDSDILTAEEKSSFFCLLITHKPKHAEDLKQFGFNMTSRLITLQRLGSIGPNSCNLTCTDRSEVFTVAVDKPVQLVGFSVYGGPTGSEHRININIKQELSGVDVCKFNEKLIADAGSKPNSVYLHDSIRLDPTVKYKVTASMTGPGTYYGVKAKGRVTQDGVSVQFNVIQWCTVSYERGRVAELLLKITA